MRQLFTALCLSFLFGASAQAAPSYKSTLSSAKNLRKSEVKLAKSIAALSATDREKLKAALASLGLDSDKDGVSDIFETARGSDVCNGDSDNDGVGDKEDNYEGSDDKTSDVEVKGSVVSFNDPTLVVADKTFEITSTTSFRDGISSKAALVPGACVKVEGFTNTSNLNIATKIEKYDRCGGQSGGDDGKDDDRKDG